MYIAPGTQIYLFKNVPLDRSYDDTVYFTSANEQLNWFISDRQAEFSPKVFMNQTYQRLERGYCRLKVKADEIADYNYMAFRNTPYSSKWWYAFILGVEWLNNEVAELHIQIDVIQTWLFDFDATDSFVERMHTRTDTIGSNLLPESFELGEYISDGLSTPIIQTDGGVSVDLSEMCIVITCNFDQFGTAVDGGMYGQIYSGLNYIIYDADAQGVSYVNNFLNAYSSKAEDILSVTMMPKAFAMSKASAPSMPPVLDVSLSKYSANGSTDIYGFAFNNNKLLTYPYCFLYGVTPNGISAQFMYEYWDTSTCGFTLYNSSTASPQCELVPFSYKGARQAWDEGLMLDGWPQCAWNADTFKLYMANNAMPGILQSTGLAAMESGSRLIRGEGKANAIMGEAYDKIISNYVPGVGSPGADQIMSSAQAAADAALGNPASLLARPAMRAVTETVGALYMHNVHPVQTRGVQQQNVFSAIGELTYKFAHKRIRPEFARIIDQYWDAYGYPCNRIITPDRTNRAKFTYIKTIGFNCTGSISSNVKEMVKAVYDHGVRWWRKDVVNIGDTTTEAANRGNYPLG